MQPQSQPHVSRRRSPLLLAVTAALFVLMPLLVWHQTWFGTQLSDRQIDEYLAAKRERRIQHALSQISDRILRGDPSARRCHPGVAALARHPAAAIRITASWVMGQDNTSSLFHDAFLGLLNDSDVMVRRNAALSLVRFQNSSGRAELIRMLRPYVFRASAAGRVSIQAGSGQNVGSGTLVARITPDHGQDIEVRSSFAGRVEAVLARHGSQVEAGDALVTVEPVPEQVWEALRALYLVGRDEDLPEVTRYERIGDTPSELTRQQARLTARAIRARSEHRSTY